MDEIRLAGCVILKGNNILLLQRRKAQWFELPGGKVNNKESNESAAIRELKEELLINIKIIKEIGHESFTENRKIFHYTWFLAKIINNEIPKIGEPEKFSKFNYIPLNELSKYKLSPNMQNFYKDLTSNQIKL